MPAAQTAQQIGVCLVSLCRLADVGLLIDRHQAHEPHQTADAFLVHQMAFAPQVPGHLANTEERCFQELLIDLPHQHQVQSRFALGRVIERRPRDRQQPALLAGRQLRIGRFDHFAPHLPIRGLRFRGKKSLATASSPILACSSLPCSSSISGPFLLPRSNTPDAPPVCLRATTGLPSPFEGSLL